MNFSSSLHFLLWMPLVHPSLGDVSCAEDFVLSLFPPARAPRSRFGTVLAGIHMVGVPGRVALCPRLIDGCSPSDNLYFSVAFFPLSWLLPLVL